MGPGPARMVCMILRRMFHTAPVMGVGLGHIGTNGLSSHFYTFPVPIVGILYINLYAFHSQSWSDSHSRCNKISVILFLVPFPVPVSFKLSLISHKCQHPYSECIFTARKRSLRRLCFYTCLSFCPRGGGCVWSHDQTLYKQLHR